LKYYIQYPIKIECSLRCPYCFHATVFDGGITDADKDAAAGPKFTVQDYINWRDKCLEPDSDIIIHFHGGEPTTEYNMDRVVSFLSNTTREKVDILSNGLGTYESYGRLKSFKDRISRIGLTYHRKVISQSSSMIDRFHKSVAYLSSWGFPVYVKELLFTDCRDQIIENKKWWESHGIQFNIQDFKGYDRGEDFTEFQKYTLDDINLLSQEYIKEGDECSCFFDYKNIIIRGGWQDGDVLACWKDPTVIGNIKDGTYNPNYKIFLNADKQRVEVLTDKKVYKGTWKDDRYIKEGIE